MQGVTLVEILFVVVVMVAIFVGAAKYFQQVNMGDKVNDAAKMIQLIWVGADDYVSRLECTPDMCLFPTDDLIPVLVANGSVPDHFKLSFLNPWGGDVEAKFIAGNKSALPVGVSIRMDGIPQEAVCFRLHDQLTALLRDPNMDTLGDICKPNGNGYFTFTRNLGFVGWRN